MARGKSIVIKREEVVEGGHHGGAWKVAYADFVTAMMAFFLLMWLLNATSQDQRRGIADYFSPHNELSRASSGFGMIFGGRTPNSVGSMASDNGAVSALPAPLALNMLDEEEEAEREPGRGAGQGLAREGGAGRAGQAGEGGRAQAGLQAAAREGAGVAQAGDSKQGEAKTGEAKAGEAKAGDAKAGDAKTGESKRGAGAADADAALAAELQRREQLSFDQAAQQIRDAVRADPALAELAGQLRIDQVPEGLRIQVLDEDRSPMFPTGSAALNERSRALLSKVAPVLLRLPQGVAIAGHTDAAPFKGGERSNWDLSADRANATRRLLVEAGLPEARLRSVAGLADREPLLREDRMAAANRRIAITVLRESTAPRDVR